MNKKKWLAALLVLSFLLSLLVSCTDPGVTDPGDDDPVEEEEPVTYANLTYELDGGTLPVGEWDKYASNADFVLPVPTKKNCVFGGWYLSEACALSDNLSKIPAGQTDDFKLYAKWYKIANEQSGKRLEAEVSRLSIDNYDDNGIEVVDGAMIWKQGTTAISQITLNDNLVSILEGSKQLTFEMDLAKVKDIPSFSSTFRLRQSKGMINIMTTDTSGSVFIGGSKKIATLTEQMQRISIFVDFEAALIVAYDEQGQNIGECALTAPSGVTLDEYYEGLTSICWQWVTNKPLTEPSAIAVDRMAIIAGNSAERGMGMPVTISERGSETKYRIVYDADSQEASDAADAILAMLAEKGLPALAKCTDSEPAKTREIVIGSTSREGNATMSALIADDLAQYAEDGAVWAYGFINGKLYIMANSDYAYGKVIDMMKKDYLTDSKLAVSSEIMSSKAMSKDEIFFESLIIDDPHDAYMSYDVYDNFYEGYTDPFSDIASGDYKAMTVTLLNATTYRIKYADERGGIFSADFVQKRWGVWMMGSMQYTEKNGTLHTMTSSGTDYEFVLRCGNEDSITFRGGNHADYTIKEGWDASDSTQSNDRLLDMTLYDAKTGDAITFKVGETKTVNGLRIVMHNNIYEQDYAQENVLINVEKSYLYNGYDILFDATLYLAQRVKFNTSYSCMLPISKQYGNCAMFYLDDGSTVYMKTPLSNTKDETRLGVDASRIDLWGEKNPKYHITIDLYNTEHQLMSSDAKKGYTGFREMLAGGSNKIYCSMFSTPGELQRGTELNFKTRWSFSVQEDFVNPEGEPDYWVGRK